MKIVSQSVDLIWITPNSAQIIENAGRTCYKSEDAAKGDVLSAEKFCKMLTDRGHESVLEHAVASFRIITDRGISHEIVRHRIASYSQESTRYCNYGKDKFGNEITVIQPPDLGMMSLGFWTAAIEQAEKHYFALINSGCAPQIARSVLPTCLKTEIVMTANFREWRHFIKMRSSSAAHPQVRWIAEEIRKILYSYSPTLFGQIDHSELVLKGSEVEAIRNLILANGDGADVNPTLIAAFNSLKKKVGLL